MFGLKWFLSERMKWMNRIRLNEKRIFKMSLFINGQKKKSKITILLNLNWIYLRCIWKTQPINPSPKFPNSYLQDTKMIISVRFRNNVKKIFGIKKDNY